MRILMVVFLVIFLTGCATTKKTQDIQTKQLQSRISYLEQELQRKNQEISILEQGLEKTQSRTLVTYKQKDIQLSNHQIQTALKNAGFYQGPIDGKIGSKTREAIRAFQKANGLKADGIVGKRTSQELSKYLAR